MGYVYMFQSFLCSVKLLLAVLGWAAHLVSGLEGAGSEVIWTCLRAPGIEPMWGEEKISVWRATSWSAEKSNSKSYSTYLEKSEKYFPLTTVLKIYMTRLILNYKAKRSLKNTFNNKKKQALLSHVREKIEISFYSPHRKYHEIIAVWRNDQNI